MDTKSTGFDMHMHSTASDGSFSPSKLVEMAHSLCIGGMALTDHDTVDGIPEATEAANDLDFPFIPGIEISTEFKKYSIHILGYWYDIDVLAHNDILLQMKESRIKRCYKIVERLNFLGMPMDAEEIISSAGNSIGRPHIAAKMVEMGYAANYKEAFGKWLGRGMPAYVDRFKITPFTAIKIIKSAGGVPVVAHPGTGVPDRLIPALVKAGIGGIEVYHSEHNRANEQKYLSYARRYHIAAMGGSDFHCEGARELGSRVTSIGQLGLLAGYREVDCTPDR